jgi:hypothetical protein
LSAGTLIVPIESDSTRIEVKGLPPITGRR